MTPGVLLRRSLRFYWRTHLGVAGGAAIGAAVLVGALAVGDSVRYSLAAMALERLGGVQVALETPDRAFRDQLADKLVGEVTRTAPVLHLAGIVSRSGGRPRVVGVRVYGIDERFGGLVGAQAVPPEGNRDAIVLTVPLASRLDARAGDTVLLRVERPGLLPRDAPLSGEEDMTRAARFTVAAVASGAGGGRFGLRAEQVPPLNAFVSLSRLQELVGLPGRANLLLIGKPPGAAAPDPISIGAALRARWQPADAGLELRELPGPGALEIRTSRVFLDPPVVQAVAAVPGARGVLTYFVNELKAGGRSTPYSMVSALGPLADPAAPGAPGAGAIPGLKDDEIHINAWLAEDLQAKPGDLLEMAYFVPGPGRTLEERRRTFRVRAVLPLEGLAADRELMPAFPGVSDVENCRDWKPGIPIHLDRIRKKDEAYWKEFRGTPKAFVTLKAGQAMWENRFGAMTAVRFPLRAGIREEVERAIERNLDPASLGFVLQPVREQALAAASQAQDFGGLFLGFSAFLIVAALLLVGLLFALGVEQRAEEAGILLAVGFTPGQVRGLFLLEGGTLAIVGGAAGALGGVLYARAVLYGLSTLWRSAVGTSSLQFFAEPATLGIGALSGFLLALVVIAGAARGLARRPARELLAGGADVSSLAAVPARGRVAAGWIVAAVAAAGAAAVAIAAGVRSRGTGAEAFFGSGVLLLVSGLAACHSLLARLDRPSAGARRLTLGGLGLLNAVRRRGRSLAVAGLLACGAFLVAAVGANRRDAGADADRRESGTGGFALWAESTIPVVQDLNRREGREDLGIDPAVLDRATVVPFRVRDGDDASCLNLNRALRPRLLGVKPEALAGRFTFAKRLGASAAGDAWPLLKGGGAEGAVPAIADDATVVWALGKSVGDVIPYTDERGRAFDVRIVATVADSVLQGSLLIAEEAFLQRFPSASGYRMFLIDAPAERAEAVASALARALGDFGLEAAPASRRLAAFHAVENTYLSVFLALGGLGMILGSLGLGVVVLRNVLERRGELALMRAVGFETGALRWLVFSEHAALLLLGLACGIAAAAVAVIPVLRAPGAEAPLGSAALMLVGVAASGALWTWLATTWALRGPLMPALRNE